MVDQFAAKAIDWDNNPVRNEMVKKFVNIIRKHAQIRPNSHILDFGCGTGLVGLHFAEEADRIKMLDTSPAMLEVLKKKVKEQGPHNVQIIQKDIAQLDEPNNLIVSLMTFHHITNQAEILREFYNKLHDNGLIIIGDLMPEDGSFHYPESVPHNGIHPNALSKLCKEAGFHVEWCYKFHSVHKKTNLGTQKSFDLFVLVARKPEPLQ